MDAHERRYSKSIDGTVVTNFGYDDHGRLVIDADASGNTRNIYVYATQGHSPDYIIHSGQEYTLIKDQLGSVVMVVNASTGAIAQQIVYDEYGRVLSDTNPGFQFIGFAGGIYDADTKLVKFGVRDYDAETGRWMSKDPIFFQGGNVNLYSYVSADPVNKLDSSGLIINDNTGGRIPDSVKESPIYRSISESSTVVNVNIGRTPGAYGETTVENGEVNITIDTTQHLDSASEVDTIIHELTHANNIINGEGEPEAIEHLLKTPYDIEKAKKGNQCPASKFISL